MKTYKKEKYCSKDEWLKARGIGGSDAAAILHESNWLTLDELFNRLVYKKEKKIKENNRMKEGTKAESHIRELWSLDNPQFKVKNPPKRTYWLFRRLDYPLITCTPDGLFKDESNNLYGLEIKDVDLIKSETKTMWESNILPNQYYIQILHYLVTMNDLKGVCLVAHLKYFKKNEETNKWEFDYAIERSYWVIRETAIKDIQFLESKEIEFIKENVEKEKMPKLVIK